jgi:iron complex transport system permease protein
MKIKYLALSVTPFLALLWISLNSGVVKLNNVVALLFGNGSADQVAIMQEIRAPRVAAAVLVGAILGIGGALSQGALRNPLAEPVLLGTSGGAALFTLAGILLFKLTIGSFAAIAFGILGAVMATLFTYAMGKNGRDGFVFVIVGIAISATLTALVGITAIMINKPEAKGVTFWTLGTLSMSTKGQVFILLPIFLITFVAAIYISPNLDYLAIGDLRAKHLGKNVNQIRFITFLTIATAVGAATSIFGQISFLALAIPHIVRAIVGPRHRNLIIHSALLGATLLLLSDLAARKLAEPNELPIGLMTALIGAPILAISARKWLRNA